MDFNESHLIYSDRNYRDDDGTFAKIPRGYDYKYLYELYYNKDKDSVLVCIQHEYYSLSSAEPICTQFNQNTNFDFDDGEHQTIYIGSGKDFYDIAINKKDIKMHSRIISRFDFDYEQVLNIYKKFLDIY